MEEIPYNKFTMTPKTNGSFKRIITKNKLMRINCLKSKKFKFSKSKYLTLLSVGVKIWVNIILLFLKGARSMNQEKIGKFIATCRKEQKLTQEQLAEKLGITYKAVSKWECGKGLPDASIMMELCKILNITVNDLLSGEKIEKEDYQKKLEKNIINTIDYSNKKVSEKNKLIYKLIMFFGLGLIFIAFTIYPNDSSWGAIHSLLGLLISTFGFVNIKSGKTIINKVFFGIGYFMIGFIFLLLLDYTNVVLNKVAPRFSYLIETGDTMIIYKAPFYNVYRINRNTKNEYYIVDTKGEYKENNIPITPFNRDKAGIDNIIQYKNKYVGNNSNDSHLIDNLPLAEYGYVFEIDSENLELIIDYHITDWYVNESHYLEKALLYNAVAIFALIDNVENITFNFSGNTYKISRKQIKELYPNFIDIVDNGINPNNFNKYLESKMNDDNFVEDAFKKIFVRT